MKGSAMNDPKRNAAKKQHRKNGRNGPNAQRNDESSAPVSSASFLFPETQGDRTAAGKRFSFLSILANLLLAIVKLAVGLASSSLSVTADAVNNLSDASSGLITLWGFKLAARPPDEEHPYGHGRYEYLAGLGVSVLILVIGLELFHSGLSRILSPEPVSFGWISAAILLFSIVVKLCLVRFGLAVGKKIGSQTVIAAAADARNDVISTAAVFLSSLAAPLTSLPLDGITALLVAGFILANGAGLVRDTLEPLLGKAPEPELVSEIRRRILSYPGVLGTHDLMIHDYGPGRQFASVHVEMAAEADVMESHDVIDRIERDFRRDGLHLVVHFDPIVTSSDAVHNLRLWLSETVRQIDPRLSVHDLRLTPGATHTNLIFDCAAPHDFPTPDASLKRVIEAEVQQTYPTYQCVIHIDRSYAVGE